MYSVQQDFHINSLSAIFYICILVTRAINSDQLDCLNIKSLPLHKI